jgi:hypothetical protein
VKNCPTEGASSSSQSSSIEENSTTFLSKVRRFLLKPSRIVAVVLLLFALAAASSCGLLGFVLVYLAPTQEGKITASVSKLKATLLLGMCWRSVGDELCELGKQHPELVLREIARAEKDHYGYFGTGNYFLSTALWFVQGNLNDAGPAVIKCYEDQDEDLRVLAVRILECTPRIAYGAPEVFRLAKQRLSTPRNEIAARILCLWESHEAVEALLNRPLCDEELQKLTLRFSLNYVSPTDWQDWWDSVKEKSFDEIVRIQMDEFLQTVQSWEWYQIVVPRFEHTWAARTGLWFSLGIDFDAADFRIQVPPKFEYKAHADFVLENARRVWARYREKPRRDWVELGIHAAIAYLRQERPGPYRELLRRCSLWSLSQFVDSDLTNDCRVSTVLGAYDEKALDRIVRGWDGISKHLVWNEKKFRFETALKKD